MVFYLLYKNTFYFKAVTDHSEILACLNLVSAMDSFKCKNVQF